MRRWDLLWLPSKSPISAGAVEEEEAEEEEEEEEGETVLKTFHVKQRLMAGVG